MHLQTRPLRGRAFTLVEVLVVVVIMGIAGAVVVPSLMRTSTFGVQAAARMSISDIIIAQNDGIAAQASRSIIFEPAQNRYRLVVTATGAPLKLKLRAGGNAADYIIDFDTDDRFAGVSIQNANFPPGLLPLPPLPTLTFDALGSPSNGGTFDLVAPDASYRVTVAPFTGRVTIAPQ